MNVVFRADASLQIGSGHVMRCLTLAHSLRERGANCRFVCRNHDGNLLKSIRDQGFNAQALSKVGAGSLSNGAPPQTLAHASWLGANWRNDAEATRAAIGETVVDWLIVDHYALDARWESAMRPQCRKIMVIDDLADREHDCDLLLDQNLVADMAQRYSGKVPTDCDLLLGPDYALLQSVYAKLHPRTAFRAGPIRRVLVYFGGADVDNLTGMAIAALLAVGCENLMVDVVINSAGPHAASIRQQVKGLGQITLHEELPSLAPLMVQSDLAIGAAGATSWERCCLGLPALVVVLAENQKVTAAEQDRVGLIRLLGCKDTLDESKLVEALLEVFDGELLPRWSERCWKLLDGRGAERVCGKIASIAL